MFKMPSRLMLSSFRPGTRFLGPGGAAPALAVSVSSAAS